MVRRSFASGLWRYLHPAYYLKRPKRLAFLFIVFVVATFAIWDRQSLIREHEVLLFFSFSNASLRVFVLADTMNRWLDFELLLSPYMRTNWNSRAACHYFHSLLIFELMHCGETEKAEIVKIQEELNRLQDQLRKSSVLDEMSENVKFIREVEMDPVNYERREKVKKAMLHAWNSYVEYAWGQDELQPQSKNGVNSFGGLGATLVDSLDTLYIMGLKDEFQKAREWIATSLDFNKDYVASVFETTIRVVGGLLSAYDMSGDKLFLDKAKDIADRLLPAWDSPTGIPYNRINLAHGNPHNHGWTGRMHCSDGCPPHQVLNPIGCPRALNDSGVAELSTMQDAIRYSCLTILNFNFSPFLICAFTLFFNFFFSLFISLQGESILADSGTEQLEFIALSQRTGDLKYQQKVEKVIRQLQKTYPSDGLLPIYINPRSGVAKPYSTITFGAMGDSFYEYLLKAWIQGNKTEGLKHYREMWETSMEGLVSLIRKSTPSSFSYICEKTGNSLSDKMDELACFAPGMLALGSSGYAPEKAEKMLSLSKEVIFYASAFPLIPLHENVFQISFS
ncbi:hypothetical protein ZIOFF_035786 [Zingiber officinale]|uniref:alpha-1,2-Mannosidase n=1 Tax=Zingiber officinale TaxID=94328 RepID=A0A8J5L846_ZINOF|nr:hypothetical protein ZIOFF_035786 [Zingiber officinale]